MNEIFTEAMRDAKIDRKDIDIFMKDCMSGDYDHLLQVCMKTVNVK